MFVISSFLLSAYGLSLLHLCLSLSLSLRFALCPCIISLSLSFLLSLSSVSLFYYSLSSLSLSLPPSLFYLSYTHLKDTALKDALETSFLAILPLLQAR